MNRVKINDNAVVISGAGRILLEWYPEMAAFEKEMRGKEGRVLYKENDYYMVELDNLQNPGNDEGVLINRDDVTFLKGSKVKITSINDDLSNCIVDKHNFGVGKVATIQSVHEPDDEDDTQIYVLVNDNGKTQWASHCEIELW